MFQQIRCKNIQSIIFVNCYVITIVLSITLSGFCIFYITNVLQTCLQNSLVNITYIADCEKHMFDINTLVITNLTIIIVNFIAFLIMFTVVDVVKEYDPPPTADQELEV